MTVLEAAFELLSLVLWKLSGYILIPLAVTAFVIVRQFMRGEKDIAKKGIRMVVILLSVCAAALIPAVYFSLGFIAGHGSSSFEIVVFILLGISVLAFVSILPAVFYIAWRERRAAAET